MKKLLIVLALLVPCIAYAVSQPQSLGVVSVSAKNLTTAQIIASTSTAKGELFFCSDCGGVGGVGALCVSTGAATGQRGAIVLSTGTACR